MEIIFRPPVRTRWQFEDCSCNNSRSEGGIYETGFYLTNGWLICKKHSSVECGDTGCMFEKKKFTTHLSEAIQIASFNVFYYLRIRTSELYIFLLTHFDQLNSRLSAREFPPYTARRECCTKKRWTKTIVCIIHTLVNMFLCAKNYSIAVVNQHENERLAEIQHRSYNRISVCY